MKKLLFLAICMLFFISCKESDEAIKDNTQKNLQVDSKCLLGQKIDMTQFELDWSDEFNGNKLDTKIWKRIKQTKGVGFPWNKNKYLSKANFDSADVEVKNGELLLNARKIKNREYSRGRIDSRLVRTYGYYEAKMKTAVPQGILGAFWLQTNTKCMSVVSSEDCKRGTGEDGAEIDIVETTSNFLNTTYQFTSIIDGYGKDRKVFWQPALNLPNNPIPNRYHIYGLHWTPNFLKFYLDGRLIGSIKDKKWIPQVNEYVILSSEFFADGFAGIVNDRKLSKQTVKIDWVRVWNQKK